MNAADIVYLVVTEHDGVAKDFTILDNAGAALTTAVSVDSEGIYPISLLASKAYGNLTQIKYDGTVNDKITGYVLAGKEVGLDRT